jgi:hypothetical protein
LMRSATPVSRPHSTIPTNRTASPGSGAHASHAMDRARAAQNLADEVRRELSRVSTRLVDPRSHHPRAVRISGAS